MKRKESKIEIKAPKEKVWKVLWDDETYGKWTAAFFEGSHAETGWKEGRKLHLDQIRGSNRASHRN